MYAFFLSINGSSARMHDHKPEKHKVKKEREEKMERAEKKARNYYTSTQKEFIINMKVHTIVVLLRSDPKIYTKYLSSSLFKDQNPTIKRKDLCTAFLAKFKEVLSNPLYLFFVYSSIMCVLSLRRP